MLNISVKSILWMLSASFWLSVMSFVLSTLPVNLPSIEVFALSNSVAFLLITAHNKITNASFHTSNISNYLLRALAATVTMGLWFWVARLLPATEAIAISYFTPLFNIIAAVFILKEQLSLRRLIMIVIGFIGVFIIFQPGFKSNPLGYVLAFGTTIIWMFSDVLAKLQSRNDPPATHCFFVTLFMIAFSLPIALFYWQNFTYTELGWIVLLGVIQLLNLYCFLQSYYLADMVKVTPFDLSRLLFTSALAYFFAGEIISLHLVIGCVLITCSMLLLTRMTIAEMS